MEIQGMQQDGKFGKCLAPRPSVGRAPSPSVGENKALNPSEMGRYSAEQFGGEFDALESLGEGGFGKIYQGFKETEVLLLQQINHINITKLFGFIKRNGIPEIIMEYAGMNLLKFVLISPTSGYINNEQIWKFTEQGLSALEYLDNRGIIHLDVKHFIAKDSL
ncbi:hypothetical protein KUTeg_008106 [Tegillarca granosa]|uniref:Protein kinase domain-containing protein n=1 Tax=Tegillarca granosa TaxID=220873 RepID=A0ABQ9FD08_TEGGR|nr:hypothetical protein KUTeg_008106 [Tegillarca granosa]